MMTEAHIELVLPWNTPVQEARVALSVLGFIPLVQFGSTEHWVRGPRRCVLAWVEGQSDTAVLERADYVYFYRVNGVLCASFD